MSNNIKKMTENQFYNHLFEVIFPEELRKMGQFTKKPSKNQWRNSLSHIISDMRDTIEQKFHTIETHRTLIKKLRYLAREADTPDKKDKLVELIGMIDDCYCASDSSDEEDI